MTPELRAPTLGDLGELVAFFEGLRDDHGERGMTESHLRDNLTSKRWKPEDNYRVALVDGRIAGWSSLWSPDDQPERIFLSLRVAGRKLPVYSPLLDWAEARAAEIAAGEPGRVNAGAVHDDEVLLAELRRRGYEFARHFFEMKIDLADEPRAPVWPDGLTVRTFTPEDFHEFRRRGRDEVGLQVDAENLTGAVGLYERAGMHVARRFERFTKELP